MIWNSVKHVFVTELITNLVFGLFYLLLSDTLLASTPARIALVVTWIASLVLAYRLRYGRF